MADERPAPAGALQPGDHACAFYTGGGAGRDQIVADYIADGLRLGDKCICYVDDARVVLANVPKSLRTRERDVVFHRAEDAYQPLAEFSKDAHLRRLHSLASSALAEGYRHFRLIGDVGWVLPHTALRDERAWFELEAEINAFAPSYPQYLTCLYDLDTLTGPQVLAILRTHPKLMLDGVVIANPGYRPDGKPLGAAALTIFLLMLARVSDAAAEARLVTTAVPALAPSCTEAHLWHPTGSAGYYSRAPHSVRGRLAALGPAGGRVRTSDGSWLWAFPVGLPPGSGVFLVAAARAEPGAEELFALTLLAQTCGTVIAKLESTAAAAAANARLSRANEELRTSVATLTRVTEIHRRLNEAAAAQPGETGIAAVLHQLTAFPVVIRDAHGSVRASAGITEDAPPADRSPGRREPPGATYRDGAWVAVANPKEHLLGVISLLDPERRAGPIDIAALEHGATILAVELARLHSLAEADLRGRRDFAEELLSGATGEALAEPAHRLGYDLHRPHQVAVLPAEPGRTTELYHAVARALPDHGAGSMVVTRPDSVVVVASEEIDWERLHRSVAAERAGACWIAVGSSYPKASEAAHSYRDARFVVELAASTSAAPRNGVLRFEALGVYGLLSASTDPAGVERFMRQTLGSLIDYDERHNASLVLTLARYLDCAANTEATAGRLQVHTNTVKYRLRRITEITGLDLNDGAHRLDLHLATRVWVTIAALHEPPRIVAGDNRRPKNCR